MSLEKDQTDQQHWFFASKVLYETTLMTKNVQKNT